MSDERTMRLVRLIDERCRARSRRCSAHDYFALTVVASVVSFLEDSGLAHAADAVENVLTHELLPRVEERAAQGGRR